MSESSSEDTTNYQFFRAAAKDEIAEGKAITVRQDGYVIGLFHSAGEFYAISDFCPHQGASLSGGYVEDGQVMCPWHAWKFRLCDGAWADSPKSPLRCQTFPLEVRGEELWVGLPVESEGESA